MESVPGSRLVTLFIAHEHSRGLAAYRSPQDLILPHLDVTRSLYVDSQMARLTGLFQRGGSYYLRTVLPNDHLLRATRRNSRYMQALGSSDYREAVLNGPRKRAEVFAGYQVPQSQPGAAVAPAKAAHLRDVYRECSEAKHRTPGTVAACGEALALYEKHTGNSPLRLLKRLQGIQSMLCSTTVSPLRGKVNSELSSGRCMSLPDALSVNTPPTSTCSSCRCGFWSRLLTRT